MREKKIVDKPTNFRPELYYGPYWDGFNDAVGSLVKQNLVSTEELRNELGRTTRYSITPKGRKRFNGLLEKLDEKEISDLTSVIRAHQRKSLTAFLKFIFRNYPRYKKRSLIVDRILAD